MSPVEGRACVRKNVKLSYSNPFSLADPATILSEEMGVQPYAGAFLPYF